MSSVEALSDTLTSQIEYYCADCSEFLWPPIILGKNGNICGNCWKTYSESDGFIPNIALEKTLEKLSIRCMNYGKGCNERNEYKQMAVHNEQCIYRTVQCPIKSVLSCARLRHNNELVDHIIQQHPKNITKSKIKSVCLYVDIKEKEKQIRLIIIHDRTFLLFLRADEENQKLSVALFSFDETESKINDYQLVVQPYYSKYPSLTYEPNKIISITNYNDYSNRHEIDLSLVKKFSVDDTYKCILQIMSNLYENKSCEEMLRNFECPVCRNYMRKPIHQCLGGHSICEECKTKINTCPICQMNFGNTRNYALENLSNYVYFPCSYLNYGCEETFLLNYIAKHEEDCKFEPYDCPFKGTDCNWTGSCKNIKDHLKDVHMDNTYIQNKKRTIVPSYLIENSHKHSYCLITHGEIFKISYKHGNIPSGCNGVTGNAYWTVQLVGPKSNYKAYSYEITLVKKGNPSKNYTLVDLCHKYTNAENFFEQGIQLPLKKVSKFLNNDYFHYIVKIVNKEA